MKPLLDSIATRVTSRTVGHRNGTAMIQPVEGIPSDQQIREAVVVLAIPAMDAPNDLMRELERLGPLWQDDPKRVPRRAIGLILLVGVRSLEELKTLCRKVREIKSASGATHPTTSNA
jgi:hypothetical protein